MNTYIRESVIGSNMYFLSCHMNITGNEWKMNSIYV